MWLATHLKLTLILIRYDVTIRRHYYIARASRFTYYWAPLTISANDLAGSSGDWILLMMSCGKRFQTLTCVREKAEFQYIGLGWKSEIMLTMHVLKGRWRLSVGISTRWCTPLQNNINLFCFLLSFSGFDFNSFSPDAIFRSLYSFPDNFFYCSTLFPEGKWLLQHIREWVFLKNN